MNKTYLFVFSLLFFCCAGLAAQDTPRGRQTPQRPSFSYEKKLEQNEQWRQFPPSLQEQILTTLRERRATAAFLKATPRAARLLLDGAFEVPADFDLSQAAQGADFFFIGEYHFNPHFLKEANLLFGLLARRGFKTLGTEFITRQNQKTLDKFSGSEINEEQFIQTLTPFMEPVYLTTLAKAKDAGLKLLALDLDNPPNAAEDWAVRPEGMEQRNALWTQALLEHTALYPGPAVVHCGLAHAQYNEETEPVSLLLQKHGKKVLVMALVKQKTMPWELVSPSDPASTDPLADLLAEKFKMDKKILVRVPEEYTLQIGSDWILYVPPLQSMNPKKFQRKINKAIREAQKTGKTPLRCLLDPDSNSCLR